MDDLKLYGQNKMNIYQRIFSEDIRMEPGIGKCAILIMERGIISRCESIQLPNNEVMKNLDTGI